MTPYAMMGLDLALRVTRYYGFPGAPATAKQGKPGSGTGKGGNGKMQGCLPCASQTILPWIGYSHTSSGDGRSTLRIII